MAESDNPFLTPERADEDQVREPAAEGVSTGRILAMVGLYLAMGFVSLLLVGVLAFVMTGIGGVLGMALVGFALPLVWGFLTGIGVLGVAPRTRRAAAFRVVRMVNLVAGGLLAIMALVGSATDVGGGAELVGALIGCGLLVLMAWLGTGLAGRMLPQPVRHDTGRHAHETLADG